MWTAGRGAERQSKDNSSDQSRKLSEKHAVYMSVIRYRCLCRCKMNLRGRNGCTIWYHHVVYVPEHHNYCCCALFLQLTSQVWWCHGVPETFTHGRELQFVTRVQGFKISLRSVLKYNFEVLVLYCRVSLHYIFEANIVQLLNSCCIRAKDAHFAINF